MTVFLAMFVGVGAQRQLLTKREVFVDDECKTLCDRKLSKKDGSDAVHDCEHACSASYEDLSPTARRAQCQRDCDKSFTKGKKEGWCKEGCDYWCAVTKVKAKWDYQFSIATTTKRSLYHGTQHSYTESTTKEWSRTVTTSMSRGFIFEGASGSSSVSKAISDKVSNSWTDEWTTYEHDEFDVEFSRSDVGKSVFQWSLAIEDNCGHEETTFTKDYAITENRDSPPCCLPGYASDIPSYQQCLSGYPVVCTAPTPRPTPAPMPTPSPSPAPTCKSWCGDKNHPAPWSTKCAWDNCNACPQCPGLFVAFAQGEGNVTLV